VEAAKAAADGSEAAANDAAGTTGHIVALTAKAAAALIAVANAFSKFTGGAEGLASVLAAVEPRPEDESVDQTSSKRPPSNDVVERPEDEYVDQTSNKRPPSNDVVERPENESVEQTSSKRPPSNDVVERPDDESVDQTSSKRRPEDESEDESVDQTSSKPPGHPPPPSTGKEKESGGVYMYDNYKHLYIHENY
jgi:hypothetical protein